MRNLSLYILSLFILLPIAVIAQDRAYPIEGDGIFSFLRRWNRVGDAYVQEFIELNSDRLNAQGGLELGTVYLIPPLHPGDEYPASIEMLPQGTDPAIFGSAAGDMTPRSDRLKNACFYIISGHGGPDPGAIARVGNRILHEDEYAYDIALRLARELMLDGATVHVIIQDPQDGIRDGMYLNNSSNETCMGEPIPRNQLDRLKQRVDRVNELYERDKEQFDYCRAIEYTWIAATRVNALTFFSTTHRMNNPNYWPVPRVTCFKRNTTRTNPVGGSVGTWKNEAYIYYAILSPHPFWWR